MTTNEQTTPAFRYIGVTDECVDCQRPGCTKMDLRSTVVIQPLDVEGNDDGDPTYYGSTCAARALGVTGKGAGRKVLDAAKGADWQTRNNADDARRMLAHYGLPETGQPDVEAMMTAVDRYQDAHKFAAWFDQKSRGDWFDMVRDMITRKQAALTDARKLKIPGY